MKINAIPTPVKRFMSNSKTAELVENTIVAVGVETGLKMIGRPTFIMMDKEADSAEKKKFAATKEMLYQGICLGLYLGFMKQIKHGIYGLVSKGLSKDPENKIKIDEFNKQSKFIEDKEKAIKTALKEIKDVAAKKDFKNKAIDEIIKLKEEMRANDRMHLGKGAKEVSAIVGSILMLTIVAPQISHFIIHPIMKVLGFKEGKKPEEAKQQIDKKA